MTRYLKEMIWRTSFLTDFHWENMLNTIIVMLLNSLAVIACVLFMNKDLDFNYWNNISHFLKTF